MALGFASLGSLLPLLALAAVSPAARIRTYNSQLDRASLTLLVRRAAAFQELIAADPAQAVALALSPGTRSRLAAGTSGAGPYLESRGTWTGRDRSFVEDSAAGPRTVHRIDTASGTLEVHYVFAPPRAACAQTIRVQGIRLGNTVAAASATAQADAAAGACEPTGDQRTAVLLLDYPDTPLPANITAGLAQNAFFGATRSLDGFWREASYGKTSASGAVFGPVTLDAGYSCSDYDNILAAALSAASATMSFRDYTRLYLVMPNSGGCAAGTGSVGCWRQPSPQGPVTMALAWVPVSAATTQDLLTALAIHEGGHALGLEHSGTLDFGAEPLGPPGAAGTFDEYGDRFSAMGLTWIINSSVGCGHYAAPQKAQLGWLQDGAGFQTVETGGSFTLSPYELPAAGPRALRIRRGTGGGSWLWLEYRQPAGDYDPSLRPYSPAVFNGALVHLEDPADTARQDYSKLLDFNPVAAPNDFRTAPLAAGQKWTDPYSNLSIQLGNATASGLTVTVSYDSASGPQLGAPAVSAANGGRMVAPGSIVSLYGSGLAPALLQAPGYPLPETLGNTTVEVLSGGVVQAARLYFVSRGQVNAQLPYDAGSPAQIRVRTGGLASASLDVQSQAAAPALFTADMSGTGSAAALRPPGYTPVTAEFPLKPGDVVILYGTGLGSVNPPIAAGAAAGDGSARGPLNVCGETVTALIGGADAKVLWAGLAPGFAGLYQINIQVPANAGTGDISVVIAAGGAASQPGVTLPLAR